jgi:CHAD domain-containing protein
VVTKCKRACRPFPCNRLRKAKPGILRKVGKSAGTKSRSSRELVAAYLRVQVDELHARESGARIDSPDAVHRMRVASRRLRSSLATFGPLLAGRTPTHLRDELLWLGAVLGPVRDVEVMRDHLHGTAAIVPVDPDMAHALGDLDRELAKRHTQAHADLIRAMNSPRYAALMVELTAFVNDPTWASEATTGHRLPALVGRACARVDRAAKAAEGVKEIGGPELHEVRKAAKRARYAAEVAGPLGGSLAHNLAGRMEDLQEVLGRHQDSVMSRELLRELASRMPERDSLGLGRLIGVERASDEAVLAEYTQALAAASTDKVRHWTHK